ncbi:FAD-binding protein [Halieaceae bacterium IMCC14734]|uniref:FAD-binding protein n=1 Tax=Candidatus Litorirhabdus singularis TaxID=2518993 RepID=A0ABT3TBL3_9GAMM|nr:FAD-dependent oxidoreductase [Candidatus Litorirhabdus singularis]MCX2979653.1 FAD-binding protein [Candidatus Litorirhabdus singularis]
MSKQFTHLASPGQIGKLTLKNRMLVSAMGVNLAEKDGTCGDRIIDYHERQARGGAGLIVLGVTGVAWPSGGNLPLQVAISDDRFMPGLQRLADAVHQHGAKLASQLHHGGMVAVQDSKEGRPLWVPSYPAKGNSDLFDSMLETEFSAFMDPDAPPIELHVMTQEDIDTLIAQFAAAAERSKRAGLDGCEIHGGHGYIISEFLSPMTNQRDDNYGGSLENRARLLLEIITAIRAAVGPDFPLWVKLDSEEFGQSEGISLADARATAIMVEAAGVDAITVTAYHDTGRGALHSESNIPHVPERMVANAIAIKNSVGIPVIASGRIEPSAANRHISQGHFDFLGMGRKLLADPDLPNKVCADTPEQIRPCVYCYCCVSQIYVLQPVKCAVNPETAYEKSRELVLASDSNRHFAVIGGGPAGMEVAHRLSARGFRVTLIESGDRLGGTLQFASIAYPPNQRLLDWLRLQTRQSNTEVLLNTRADTALLKRLGVDEVIVATGAQRDMPDIDGSEQDFVFSGDEMRALVLGEKHPNLPRKTSSLTRLLVNAGVATGVTKNSWLVRQASKVWLPLGKEITIIGAELVGLELAEFLAERGRKVTVIEPSSRAGKGLYLVRRMRLLAELDELGVVIIKNAKDIAIADHQVSYINYRGQQRHLETDHVIVAQGATGNTELAEQLESAGFTTHTIGDCNGVGYIEGAIESAAELAVQLG